MLLLPNAEPLFNLRKPWRNMLHARFFFLYVSTAHLFIFLPHPHQRAARHSSLPFLQMPGLFLCPGKYAGINVHWQVRGRLCHWRSLQKHSDCLDVGADQTGAGPADNAVTSLIAVDFAADR